ncbi:unnamed protein product, partial [Psylliodes chrysocephalus]
YRPPNAKLSECLQCLDIIIPQIITSYDTIIILGDVNVDMFVSKNKMIESFNSYGLVQLITEATHITETSATLIDPIFINTPTNVTKQGTINIDLFSNHQMTFCELTTCKKISHDKFVTYRDFSNFNTNLFNHDLLNIPWHSILQLNSIDQKIEFLSDNITCLFDLHSPFRTARVKRSRAPWLTANLKLIFKERDKALRKYKQNRTLYSWNE